MSKYKYNTIQEAWDVIYVGMAEQGWKQAINAEGGCEYLTSDGLRCAVGHLLKGRKGVKELDGDVFDIDYFLEERGIVNTSNRELMDFLKEVQEIHDGIDIDTKRITKVGVDDMKRDFGRIARRYKLVNPVVE